MLCHKSKYFCFCEQVVIYAEKKRKTEKVFYLLDVLFNSKIISLFSKIQFDSYLICLVLFFIFFIRIIFVTVFVITDSSAFKPDSESTFFMFFCSKLSSISEDKGAYSLFLLQLNFLFLHKEL